jgi:hypothetical protein
MKSENAKNLRTLEYVLYGMNISAVKIIAVKVKVAKINGTCGTSNLSEAPIAPMSVPILMVLAIKRREDTI